VVADLRVCSPKVYRAVGSTPRAHGFFLCLTLLKNAGPKGKFFRRCTMKKQVTHVLVALLLILSTPAILKAGGGDQYPNVAEGFLVGIAPPPGFYAINYDYFYFSHDYKDDSGDSINTGPLDDFSLRVFANVTRLIYITPIKILGANYGVHAFFPWLDVNANCKGFHVHKRGLGDIIIDPFILTWHTPHLHVALGLPDIYLPTGEYDKYRPVNIGKNFYTFEPVLAVTFLPHKKMAVSFKFMYDFNTTNNDWINPATGKETSLHPGQEFHFDYSLSWALLPSLRLGLTGYYYQQTTDDEIDDKDVEHNRGKTIAVGPGIMWNHKRLSLILRTQYEFGVKNRPQGHNVWFKIAYKFL